MPLFMGGTFNNVDPIIGLPLYVWEWIINIILIIATWAILWWFWWKPHEPFHGIFWAWKDGSNAAFIADKNLVAEMVPERLAKCIFDYSKDDHEIEVPYADVPIIGWITTKIWVWSFYYPTKYLNNIDFITAIVYKLGHVNKDVEIAVARQNGEWERYPSVICGGVPVDIVIDTDNWTIPTSKQHLAIVKSAKQWNIENPKDQVHSYSKYYKYVTKGDAKGNKIPQPPEIKLGYEVPWTRIEVGYPMDLEESDWAGKRRQMAVERQGTKDQADRFRLAIMILVGGVAFGALEIVARLAIFLITYKPS
jgi:hypothetical protein